MSGALGGTSVFSMGKVYSRNLVAGTDPCGH